MMPESPAVLAAPTDDETTKPRRPRGPKVPKAAKVVATKQAKLTLSLDTLRRLGAKAVLDGKSLSEIAEPILAAALSSVVCYDSAKSAA